MAHSCNIVSGFLINGHRQMIVPKCIFVYSKIFLKEFEKKSTLSTSMSASTYSFENIVILSNL